jgi:bacteriocin-like protein
MNQYITPEIISDEQLEQVSGGLADVENNSCVALYQVTAQINL